MYHEPSPSVCLSVWGKEVGYFNKQVHSVADESNTIGLGLLSYCYLQRCGLELVDEA